MSTATAARRALSYGQVRPTLHRGLHNGDTLSQNEFDRLYSEQPDDFHAELVEGEVFLVNEAIGFESHAEPDAELAGWMLLYRVRTLGVASGTAATTILDAFNQVEPDLQMRIKPEYGGRSFVIGKCVKGAPELACEIAFSSKSIDLGRKKRVYEKNGVQEYLVFRSEDRAVDWWELRNGVYAPLPRDEEGCIHSHVFPGLVLDVMAFLRGDIDAVLERQRSQLGQPRHREFCEALQAKSGEANKA